MNVLYYVLAALAVLLVLGYLFGPRIPRPVYPTDLPQVPADPAALDRYVSERESAQPLRPDNGARIVWHGDRRAKTPFAFVYLHGFAGSYRDGYPGNVNIADSLGANLYLDRWAGHGLQPAAALKEFSAEAAWASARAALAIGQRIGEKVVILSTSTGGTLALKLAAEYPEAVHGLVNVGPNVEDDQPGASVLMSPWGHELAMLVSGGSNKKISHEEPQAGQYFDTIYPARALVDLEVLVQTTMTEETFRRVRCPVLTVFYKENFFQKDSHVEVSRYPEVHEQFATPPGQKKLLPLPTPKTHFVLSDIKSEDWRTPQREIIAFCRGTLGM